ncbi:WecB/TagA/CpsF family glycosyltransferase [Xylophilus rhododendri]|uniref:WecB/TagA/CpsF family glycosyltransferase n=1 Tax=Xylophilus rhododendri TaxID=2697032 RepID=A0A857JA11_9BURK|nr:WecB/TagA/CpsF family glycosyltransferase [Xylophilus rhododendri]QHI99879.1 WecB/TagA/CpsF family glycosyltransferase [Xylophilus rhododendri]
MRYTEAADRLTQTATLGVRPATVVVTTNVDHLVRLDRATAEFVALYRDADAIFADGMPLVWASHYLAETPLPERVTGADLFVTLAERAAALRLPIFVVGGMPGDEPQLTAELSARFPGLQVEVYSPSMQFSADGIEGYEAVRRIARSQPAMVFVCLGMPKQETWAMLHRSSLATSVVMCVGAALEFALGHKRRAPLWMQRHGMEWLWRLATEPRRLWRRYLVQSVRFIRLLWNERTISAQRSANVR